MSKSPEIEGSGVREHLFSRGIFIPSPGGYSSLAKAVSRGEITPENADRLADGTARLLMETAEHADEYPPPEGVELEPDSNSVDSYFGGAIFVNSPEGYPIGYEGMSREEVDTLANRLTERLDEAARAEDVTIPDIDPEDFVV